MLPLRETWALEARVPKLGREGPEGPHGGKGGRHATKPSSKPMGFAGGCNTCGGYGHKAEGCTSSVQAAAAAREHEVKGTARQSEGGSNVGELEASAIEVDAKAVATRVLRSRALATSAVAKDGVPSSLGEASTASHPRCGGSLPRLRGGRPPLGPS